MTKVIIEVKDLQNNDLIGKVVLSIAGRDKDHLYVIVDVLKNDYVLLSNGNTKTVQMPKRKSLKHLKVLNNVDDEIKESIISKDRGTDLKIKRFLKLKGIVKEGWLPYVKRWCNRNAGYSTRSIAKCYVPSRTWKRA